LTLQILARKWHFDGEGCSSGTTNFIAEGMQDIEKVVGVLNPEASD
jgi:hypothetical protein